MCEQFDVTPIVTIDNAETAGDMADFVEFAHGDPVATEWGRKRAALGHPQPYAVSHVEIGNEQGLDAALAAQFSAIATSMDSRVEKLKLPFNFSYVFGPRPDLSPAGHWSHNWSDPGLGDVADAMAPFGDRAFWDLHVESKGVDSLVDASGMDELRGFLAKRGQKQTRAVVLEENGCGFSHHCALNHAVLANEYRKRGGFIRGNSITNALEAYHHIEQYSQGTLSFLPNMTISQPTFHANSMYAAGARNITELNTTVAGANIERFQAAAGLEHVDGDSVEVFVVRIVNYGAENVTASVELHGLTHVWPLTLAVNVTTLAGALSAVNTPASPETVAPVHTAVRVRVLSNGPGSVSFDLPVQPTSLTIVRVAR